MDLKKKYLGVWLVVIILIGVGISTYLFQDGEEEKITVSAASSMSQSLKEIKTAFEKEYPDVKIYYNFGGTGALRRQVEQGAPADLFILASERDYQLLMKQDTFVQSTPFLKNQLVMVGQTGDQSVERLAEMEGRLAIGTPHAVPAGTYAKQALKSIGLWELLEDQGRLVFAKDASHVVQLVEQGVVQSGIVYQSDAVNLQEELVTSKLDPTTYDSIHYYLGELNGSSSEAAQLFYDFLLAEVNMERFNQYGFNIQ